MERSLKGLGFVIRGTRRNVGAEAPTPKNIYETGSCVIREEGGLANRGRNDYAIGKSRCGDSRSAGRVLGGAENCFASDGAGASKEKRDCDCGEYSARWEGWGAARQAHQGGRRQNYRD